MSVSLFLRLFYRKDQESFLCYIRKQLFILIADSSHSSASPLSRYISTTCGTSFNKSARSVSRSSALRVASQSIARGLRNHQKVRMIMNSSIVPICRASSLALVSRCLNSYIMTNFKIHLDMRTRSEQASVGKRTPSSILL